MTKSKTSASSVEVSSVDKYYFYITESDDIVLGYEKEKDYFFNKVIGNISDIKGKKIFLADAICTSIEDVEEEIRPTFFDMVLGLIKVF